MVCIPLFAFLLNELARKALNTSQLGTFSAFASPRPVFLNRPAAARYRALASIIPGRERPEESTICYKISLGQLITNLNVIVYLSTCHTVYIIVLILFMIMP